MSSSGEKDKREQILLAAVKVFSRKGFHDAKVDEIAQLADVGKGTVYEYFSSKRELFQEMFRTGMQFYMDNIKNELKPGLSSYEKLFRIAKIHFNFVAKYKDLARITMTEHTYFNEDFRKWIWETREKKITLLKQIIDEGIANGEFRQVDSYTAAFAFSGSIAATFAPVIFSKDKSSYKGIFETVMDLFFSGLLNKR